MSGDEAAHARLLEAGLLLETGERPCPYLDRRQESDETWIARRLDPAVYRELLDLNYRRSGHVVYRPRCGSCTECRQLRVPVEEFRPSRSQRRCLARNRDLSSRLGPPRMSDEKADLYARYLHARHPGSAQGDDPDSLEEFLHHGCVPGLEIETRDPTGRLVCVSHVDPLGDAWSSVYCYFEPDERRRGLGTWSILAELRACLALGVTWYYLGYYVDGSATMAYKARFLPCEVLGPEGWSRRESPSTKWPPPVDEEA